MTVLSSLHAMLNKDHITQSYQGPSHGLLLEIIGMNVMDGVGDEYILIQSLFGLYTLLFSTNYLRC